MENINCSKPLTSYQIANLSDEEAISQFVVRQKEFERIISEVRRDDMKGSIQHYLIIGRRGSGKSTLLRRIEAEISTDQSLSESLIVINLSEEQAGIYRLYDLWDYVIRYLKSIPFSITAEPKWNEKLSNADYSKELYQFIQNALELSKKKLVLLLDNIDRIFDNLGDDAHLLREILTNFKDIRIIGASTRMSEHYWQYDKPFYQFFRIIKLNSLDSDEVKKLLFHWASCLQNSDIMNFLHKNSGKVDTIRVLTDGMPRTLLNFIELLIDRPKQNGYDYLRLILDRATPLYQERLNSFPPAQRKIIIELANYWEAVKVGSLVEVCKMPGKTISAQLSQLVREGVVEKIKGNKKDHLYGLTERFYNLWLIMTQGGPKEKRRVKYLTIFLENWYDQEELKKLFIEHMEGIKLHEYNPGYVAIYSTALAHSKHLSIKERDELIEISRGYDAQMNEIRDIFPALSKEIYTNCFEKIKNNDFEGALIEISDLEQDDTTKDIIKGVIYYLKSDYLNSEIFYKKAIEKGDVATNVFLANLYSQTGRLDEAEIYYKEAIVKGDVDANFFLANLYRSTNKLEEAEKYYKEAINKGHIAAINNLAILYNDTNRLKEAERFFKKAIQKGHDDALYNLADLYRETNRVEKAIKYYKESVDKGNIDALNNIANLLSENNRLEEAEKYYLEAIEKGHLVALLNLAIFYHKANRLEEAERFYKEAIERGENDAINNLGSLYQETNRIEEAEMFFKEAIQKGDINALNNLANLCSENDRLEEAEMYYKEAITKGHIKAINNLATLYREIDRLEEAERYYKKAIDKGDNDAINNLGSLFRETNRMEEAEKYFKEAIQKGDINALNNLANLYGEKNRLKEAERYYKEAITMGHVKAMYNLANLYRKTDRLEEAEKYFNMAMDKGDADAMNNLANIYQETNRIEEAKNCYKKAIDKGHVSAMFNLANLYRKTNMIEEAEKYYKEAIDRGNIAALNNLGILYRQSNRLEDAEKYYLEAIEKGNIKALQNLAKLYSESNRIEDAERYYKEAIQKGVVGAMFSLANLYSETEREEEADSYYKLAIENGHKGAMFLLVLKYYNKNENKQKAFRIADKYLTSTDDVFAKSLQILMLLWKSEIKKALEKADVSVPYIIDLENIELLSLLISEFLVHKQYNFVWQLFSNDKYGSKLKEMVLPLYYVCVGFLTPEERGEELLKPGSEIAESIEKSRQEIIERQMIYE